jgi:hypothetical protein
MCIKWKHNEEVCLSVCMFQCFVLKTKESISIKCDIGDPQYMSDYLIFSLY